MADARYFDLTIPAPRRLAMMREAFAKHPQRFPQCPEQYKPADWRAIRGWTHKTWQSAFATLDQGKQGNTPIWYTHAGPEFRDEREAHDILRSIGHTGWFTDADATETAVGIVARIPHGRFLAGYFWHANGERVYFPDVYDDEREAARAADGHAERFAEDSREDSERFNAMQDAEDKCTDALREVHRAFALRHHPAGGMSEARDAIEALREAREAFADATRAYEKG